MLSWSRGLSLACLLALALSILGCNNALNPFCGSARPAPLIASLSPNTMTLAELQTGATLTVTGSHFVSSTEVLINSTPFSATVVSDKKLTIKVSSDVIPSAGQVKIQVMTPSGNTDDLGCSSGGTSSALMLTVN